MSAHHGTRPLLEPISPNTPVAAGPDAATGAPTPQQMLALLRRASAETAELRDRLRALTAELDAAAARLSRHFGDEPRLTAVRIPAGMPLAPAGSDPLDPTSPAMSVAVEMAVAGFSREETHTRLSDAFGIAHAHVIVDDVFGTGC